LDSNSIVISIFKRRHVVLKSSERRLWFIYTLSFLVLKTEDR
jgi:hypothetical protein